MEYLKKLPISELKIDKAFVQNIDRDEKDKAIVEGVNMIKKHTKPNAESPQGGIIEKEAPIHISNLMIADPKTQEATKIGRRLDANGKLVRYSKKSEEEKKPKGQKK